GVEWPVQYVFDRTASSGLERGQYLAVSLSGAYELDGRRVEELRASFVAELARLLPRATFRQGPGTLALRRFADVPPRVHLAGAWTDTGWPATMEGAVRSGLAAARAALAQPAREEAEVA